MLMSLQNMVILIHLGADLLTLARWCGVVNHTTKWTGLSSLVLDDLNSAYLKTQTQAAFFLKSKAVCKQ